MDIGNPEDASHQKLRSASRGIALHASGSLPPASLLLPRFILTCDLFMFLRGSSTTEYQIGKCYFSERTRESLESPRKHISSIAGPICRTGLVSVTGLN